MAKEEGSGAACCDKKGRSAYSHGSSGAIYGLGLIGAVVYYIQHATTFWEGILGFFKGIFWPAMLVHKVLDLLKM